MKYHDHIYQSYKEETIKIITDFQIFEILEDPKIEPIIIALRDGPLTVRELEEKYNEIVKDRVEDMDLTQKQKADLLKKLKRKSKTLYKYLNILENNDFVVSAGKRIVENQTASETLYGRTAKLFLHQGGEEKLGNDEEVQSAMKLLAGTLEILNKRKGPSITALKSILTKMNEKIDTDISTLIIDYSEEFSKLAEDSSYQELKNMFFGLKMLLLLRNYNDFEEDLKKNRII